MFHIFLNLSNDIFVRCGIMSVEKLVGSYVVHQNLFSELTHLIYLTLELCILSDKSLVH